MYIVDGVIDSFPICPTTTPTPTVTPTITETPTNTPTMTVTPTITPTHIINCICIEVYVSQLDLDAATGNTNPSYNNLVTISAEGNKCDGTILQENITTEGYHYFCIETITLPNVILFYQSDDTQFSYPSINSTWLNTSNHCDNEGMSCPSPIWTTTPTPTMTQTPTPTITETPTNTPTPTPPSIVSDGLVLYYDFSNPVSYSGSGSNIIDLSTSNNNGTVVNDYGHISYVSSGSNSYFNWDSNSGGNGGSNSFSGSIWTTSANTYLDFTMILQPDFSMAGIGGIFGFPSDKSLRVYNNGWLLPNPGNGDDWSSSPTTFYVNGQVSNQMVSGWNIIGGAKNNTNLAFPNNNTLYIGTSAYDNRNMQGKIAVVLMYNRTLTQQEQVQNYNFFKTRFGL
jgi:hypothetical protein